MQLVKIFNASSKTDGMPFCTFTHAPRALSTGSLTKILRNGIIKAFLLRKTITNNDQLEKK